MAEILAVKSLCGGVVGWVGGWVPVHRLVTATVRFGCDNNESFKHGKNVATVGDVVIVERSRFREGLYGVIEELLSSTSARVRTRLGSETQKLACLVPIVMQPANSDAESSSNLAQPVNL